MTLTYLTSRSSLLPNAFEWKIELKSLFFEYCGSQSLFSLDMFNLVAINKFQRSRLIFDLSAKVAYIGVPSTY